MPRPGSDSLTPREAEIMAVLWESAPMTSEQIREALPDSPHDSTVRTLLRVLETKGYVRHELNGKAYEYRPAIERARAEQTALHSIIKRFFGGSAEALVLRLIEDEQITPEQLEQLQRKPQSQKNEIRTGDKA